MMHLRLHDSEAPSSESAAIAEINIIPLVDVMLVLLIIFMVTAPLSVGGLSVNLPTSQSKATNVDHQRVVLSITRGGKFVIEQQELSSANLKEYLQTAFRGNPNKNLYIKGDRNVPYGVVVEAMSVAKSAGVNKLAMLAKQPQTGG
jgi:biopolymer transport protein TolR